MKIALIGYGKMGKAIEEIALEKGHSIVLKITSSNTADLTEKNLQQCDVAIEFTTPKTAVENMMLCIEAGVPVVCGSTGWYEKEESIKDYCITKNGTLLYAGNFSIGVNIFFELNKKLASLMSSRPLYKVGIEEIHHTQKKDAPSGTAITLAQQIIGERSDKTGWALNASGDNEINIVSKREDPAPGTHHVRYTSTIDEIEIIHTARSRKGFAEGALAAAAFIAGKKGIYTMQDVLKIY